MDFKEMFAETKNISSTASSKLIEKATNPFMDVAHQILFSNYVADSWKDDQEVHSYKDLIELYNIGDIGEINRLYDATFYKIFIDSGEYDTVTVAFFDSNVDLLAKCEYNNAQ
jgi:hypothetical protein